MVSVVIPIYNEEYILKEHAQWFKDFSRHVKIIFVDGGSLDQSREVAKEYGEVLTTRKGRSLQMNFGANFADGNILLFLHADTIISLESLRAIEKKLTQDSFIGGCLTQRIDNESFIYRLIEGQGNIRAKLTKEFYGDQGIFVRKDVFLKLGGFPEVPIMEDVIFTRRLRRYGKTIVMPDKIIVSPRRWQKKGIINTALLYMFINILFWFNVSLNKIKLLYDDLR